MILAVFIGLIALLCLYGEFFLPGGILALFAVIMMIASSLLFFMETEAILSGVIYSVSLILAGVFTAWLALKMIRRSNNSFCLKKDQEGFVSPFLEGNVLSKEGIVATELKPAGHVRIEGKLYQALSQGDFIEKGTQIEVIAIRGSHLVVKQKNKGNI